MIEVTILAILFAVGLLGVWGGLRSSAPRLEAVWTSWQGPAEPRQASRSDATVIGHLGREITGRLTESRWTDHAYLAKVRSALAVTDSDLSLFASRLVVIAGICGLTPFGLWFLLLLIGCSISFAWVVVVAAVAAPLAVVLVVSVLFNRAAQRRHHFRVVIGSFVDLVVLSLAGGVGIDGALYSAALVTPDWAAQRMAQALLTARDSGIAPWTALAAIGSELDIPELVELSTMVQLAGTEGARIRQSLAARGASLRRHEQAEAESAANAMTERLFLPGALLLLGFLVFIGYPAVHRILGGF